MDVLSLFVPSVFWFVGGAYRKGPLFDVYHGLFGIVFVLMIFLIYQCRKELTRQQALILAGYIIVPVIGTILQIYVELNIDITNMAAALSAIVVYVTVHIKRSQMLVEKEREAMYAQTALLRSQLQPHFLYNALKDLSFT